MSSTRTTFIAVWRKTKLDIPLEGTVVLLETGYLYSEKNIKPFMKYEYNYHNLDIIRSHVFDLKHNVSETGFCLRLQVEHTQLGPVSGERETRCIHYGTLYNERFKVLEVVSTKVIILRVVTELLFYHEHRSNSLLRNMLD
jgi:hypothetical protein